MVEEPLAQATDLLGFPGAPFSPGVVAAAAGQVRDACGWHIAPKVVETIEVETGGGTVVLLPSLAVVSVTEVKSGETVLTGWRVASNGVLRRPAGWPATITVTLEHGYAKCPPGLFAVIAEHGQRIKSGAVKSESLSGRSVSLDTSSTSASTDTLARYTLPPRP